MSLNDHEYMRHITDKARGNLDVLCGDDDDEKDKDYYDETNGLPIDEEWFERFCHKCGFDRETEQGKCMACGSKYINFFKKDAKPKPAPPVLGEKGINYAFDSPQMCCWRQGCGGTNNATCTMKDGEYALPVCEACYRKENPDAQQDKAAEAEAAKAVKAAKAAKAEAAKAAKEADRHEAAKQVAQQDAPPAPPAQQGTKKRPAEGDGRQRDGRQSKKPKKPKKPKWTQQQQKALRDIIKKLREQYKKEGCVAQKEWAEAKNLVVSTMDHTGVRKFACKGYYPTADYVVSGLLRHFVTETIKRHKATTTNLTSLQAQKLVEKAISSAPFRFYSENHMMDLPEVVSTNKPKHDGAHLKDNATIFYEVWLPSGWGLFAEGYGLEWTSALEEAFAIAFPGNTVKFVSGEQTSFGWDGQILFAYREREEN